MMARWGPGRIRVMDCIESRLGGISSTPVGNKGTDNKGGGSMIGAPTRQSCCTAISAKKNEKFPTRTVLHQGLRGASDSLKWGCYLGKLGGLVRTGLGGGVGVRLATMGGVGAGLWSDDEMCLHLDERPGKPGRKRGT